jgi:hypothetical protein
VLEIHPSPSRWIRVSVDLPGFNLDSLLIDWSGPLSSFLVAIEVSRVACRSTKQWHSPFQFQKEKKRNGTVVSLVPDGVRSANHRRQTNRRQVRALCMSHGPTPCSSRFLLKSLFSSRKVNPKSATVSVTSNFAAHAWSTKCRRKKKLIIQFSCKSRDKSFEPN